MTIDVLLRTHQTFDDAAVRLREVIAGMWAGKPFSAVEIALMESATEDLNACSRTFARMEAALPLLRESLSEEAAGFVDRATRELERAAQLLDGANEAFDKRDVPTFHQLVRLSCEHSREAHILTTAARFAMEEGVEISDLSGDVLDAEAANLAEAHERMGADLAEDLERLGY
jgi:hypothetical protein